MTTSEEWTQIQQNADTFMFETYDPETVVDTPYGQRTLEQLREYELQIRNPEELLADPQEKRAGVWARLLDGAGVLRPEHQDLVQYAGDYHRA